MEKKILYNFILFVLSLLFCLCACSKSDTDQEGNPKNTVEVKPGLAAGELYFVTGDGKRIIKILIEIAEDEYSRVNGLMFRESLAETEGMLFIFPSEEMQSFWMKNTPVSLDMIFINNLNKIVSISKYTTPYSSQSYSSTAPARYVVEVNAGFCDRYEIKPGYYIDWKRIKN